LYKLIVEPKAQNFYKRLCTSSHSHFFYVSIALKTIKNFPFRGKPLKFNLEGNFSLRIGIYRIIYTITRNPFTIYVLKIAHNRNFHNQ
jgi:mRNA interferase RelE/StbE